MKNYMPGQGSYKAEEAGGLTGIKQSYNVDNSWGTLIFNRDDVKIKARGLDIALSSRFNSDHLYSTVIPKVSKSDGPSDTARPIPNSMMTLPANQANFYRIANGWSWDLPYVLLGVPNAMKYASGNGKIFDFLAVLTTEAWGAGLGNHTWTEGYEVTYAAETTTPGGTTPTGGAGNTGYSLVTIVIPEIRTTIVVDVYRSGNATPWDFTPQNDSFFAIYLPDGRVCKFNSNGLLSTVSDPAGKNSVTYSYVTDALVGTVPSVTSRRQFSLATSSDYDAVLVGDLIIINDEIDVVFSKDNAATYQISVSSGFDVTPVAGVTAYTILKGQVEEIVHTDGRAVKFYYYPSGDNRAMTILLSSDPTMGNFVAGDQFLGLYTIGPNNQLTEYQSCSDWSVMQHPSKTGGFAADLAANQSSYFLPMQQITYTYDLTSTPDPSTDMIVVTNNVGAPTIYYFQKSGFASHSWNNTFFHRGACRRGGSTSVMNIERPDFYINPGNYVNINRIDGRAFEEEALSNYELDVNIYEFQQDNEFNSALTNYARGANIVKSTDGTVNTWWGQTISKSTYTQDRQLAANSPTIGEWAPVGQVTSPNRLLVGSPYLTVAPRQNDVYAMVNFAPDGFKKIGKASLDSTRVYFSVNPGYNVNDFILLRTEIHQIGAVGTEVFGSTTYYYVDAATPFAFVPAENEQAAFLKQATLVANEAWPARYYCYYLNKPKVVRIDFMPSFTPGTQSWKRIDYQYSYQIQGLQQTDTVDEGGFTLDNVEGPYGSSFDASDIALKATRVTTGVTSASGQEDLYCDVYTFAYDQKNFLMGTSSVTRLRVDTSTGSWFFVRKTANTLGRPCANAPYYDVTSSLYYEGGDVTNITDGGASWRKRTDYRFDYYGRPVRTRITSPSFEGRQDTSTWTQYVGSSPFIDDLDPLGMFAGNYLGGTYQSICNTFHALGLVGATIEQIDSQSDTKIIYNGFDPATMNLLMTDVLIVSSLSSYEDLLSTNSPNFRVVDGSNIVTDPTLIRWTADGVTYSSDWSSANFPGIVAHAITRYSYDSTTNNLISITKPLGNAISLTYGTSWMSSYITKDVTTLDANISGTTQYVVNTYDYDIKGRLIERVKIFSSDTSGTPYTYGGSAPETETQFTYDGMDRVLTKSVGDGTTQTAVLGYQYLDTGDSSWPGLPYVIATNYLGFRVKTYSDALYRVVQVGKYKPNQPTGGDLNYSSSWEVQIEATQRVYQEGIDKVARAIQYTNVDQAMSHTVTRRYTYDNIGRLTRVELKNGDSNYQGDSVFHVVKNIEYDETKNAVITSSYMDDSSGDYLLSEVDNDWLGRGPLAEISWTGVGGTGITRKTVNHYRYDGRISRRDLPNNERYFYSYSSVGQLEYLAYPDGTDVTRIYDLNGNVSQTIDRTRMSVSMSYNQSDLEVERTAVDAVRGNTVISATYTQFGPAEVVKTENAATIVESDYEYDLSGKPNLRKQTMDGYTMQVAYGFDAAGNLISITPTGSGSSPWTNTFEIVPQFHAANPDTDNFNRSAVVDGSTGLNVITVEPDFLGLTASIKYGDYASPLAQMKYGYDEYLRAITLQSQESTPNLSITLTRDFIGNILSRVEPAYGSVPATDFQYAYDGMNRLSSGEGASSTYDELSNLVTNGPGKYVYQDPSTAGDDQMRLASFTNGGMVDAYTYDANGSPTAIGNRFSSLSYDNLRNLREIVYSQTDEYWYDFLGLRVKKTENATGTWQTTYTMFEGNNPLMQEVYTADGRIQVVFNIIADGEILAQYKMVYPSTSSVVYFFCDNLGSRRVVLVESATVIDRYRYSAWGQVTQDVGTDSYASFTGKDYDASGLVYFNARYYDPAVGRFLSEDRRKKGVNWYAYGDNDPINTIDPSGLWSVSVGFGWGGFAVSASFGVNDGSTSFGFTAGFGEGGEVSFNPGTTPSTPGTTVSVTASADVGLGENSLGISANMASPSSSSVSESTPTGTVSVDASGKTTVGPPSESLGEFGIVGVSVSTTTTRGTTHGGGSSASGDSHAADAAAGSAASGEL